MSMNASQLGLKPEFVKEGSEIRVHKSRADALDDANQHRGSEAVLELSDGQFAVVDLTTKAMSANGSSADAAFLFVDSVVPEVKSVILTGDDRRVKLVTDLSKLPRDEGVKEALDLGYVAAAGKTSGFKRSETIDEVAGKVYRDNLNLALGEVDRALGRFAVQDSTRFKSREHELRVLIEEGQAAKPPKDVSGLEQELATVRELTTVRGLLVAKLLVSPVNKSEPIAGTGRHVGQFRHDFAKVADNLEERVTVLESERAKETDPGRLKGFDRQIAAVKAELVATRVLQQQVIEAQAAFRIRRGALATIAKAVTDAGSRTQAARTDMAAIRAAIKDKPVDAADLEKKLPSLENVLETERKQLREVLVKEIAAFEKHCMPGLAGTNAALKLLKKQIERLDALDPSQYAANLSAPDRLARLEAVLGAIDDARKALRDKVAVHAAVFNGVTPEEGKAILDIDSGMTAFVADYKALQGEIDAARVEAAQAKKASAFIYGITVDPFSAVVGARTWKPGGAGMSGADANNVINRNYVGLDKGMTVFLNPAGTPPLPLAPSWLTFGLWASVAAGNQIANMEAAVSAMHTWLDHFDGNLENDTVAAAKLFKLAVFDDDALMLQGARLAYTKVMGKAPPPGLSIPMLAASVATSGVSVKSFVMTMESTVRKLRDELVLGNTEIYRNAGQTFDAFLKAEERGENGVEALIKAHLATRPGQKPPAAMDPQGLVYRAFSQYREARNLSVKAANLDVGHPPDPAKVAERDGWLKKREALIEGANRLFVSHEQMEVAQPIYDRIMREVGAMTGTMTIVDPAGTHKLLDGNPTGNWAVFKDRMGWREAKPTDPTDQVIEIKDPKGVVHRFVPDPSQKGTIEHYFHDGMDPARAKLLMDHGKVPTQKSVYRHTPTVPMPWAPVGEWVLRNAAKLF